MISVSEGRQLVSMFLYKNQINNNSNNDNK